VVGMVIGLGLVGIGLVGIRVSGAHRGAATGVGTGWTRHVPLAHL